MSTRQRFGRQMVIVAGILGMALAGLCGTAAGAPAPTEATAKELLKLAGTDAGLCLHLGAGTVKSAGLTADLAAAGRMLVHGIALDEASLARARKAIDARNLAGRANVENVPVSPLPYLPDLTNLVVIEDFAPLAAKGLTMDEVNRVVAPGGAVCILKGGRWSKTVKPRPAEMSDWTHPAHGPDGNRVSADRAVRFPVGLRWQDGVPLNFNLWASCRAWVIAGGRCFTLSTTEYENLGPASFAKPRQEEYVTARDAFNGLPLWKVNCETVNDGKALNARNTGPLVADGKRVYAYKKDRVVALDAATGEVVKSYPVKYQTVRLVLLDGVLISSGWEAREAKGLWDPWVTKTDAGAAEAFDAETAKPLWSVPLPAQQVLAADGMALLVVQSAAPAKEQTLVAVDLKTGKERWRVPHTALTTEADLQVTALGLGIVAVARAKDKAVSVLSAEDGKKLWEIPGADKPWTPLADGFLCYRDKKFDPKTGEVKGKLPTSLDSPGCTPAAMTGGIVTASRGCSYIDMTQADPAKGKGAVWINFAGARGGCLQGSVPANGMFYTSQNFCRCAPGQVQGFVAFGPSGALPTPGDFETSRPIEKGPAFGKAKGSPPAADDWPMFLRDAQRSGATAARVPEKLKVLWQAPVARPLEGPLTDAWRARLTSCLTAPVAAGGLVYASAVEEGQVVALDAATGKPAWRASTGSRVDGPPTLYAGLCLFGSHDGWVYAVQAKDGQLAWRTRAAPWERRMVAFGQVESVWPVPASVLIQENVVYATAGRTSEADGGMAVLALDPATGQQVWAKNVAPGPVRQNDLLALRGGKVTIYHIQLDPKTGAGDTAAKAKDYNGTLEGMNDGTWTRLGTRRSGELEFGKTRAELLAWNDTRLIGYNSKSRTCFAMKPDVARAAEKPTPQDYLWRLSMPADQQVEAMALCDGALVLAGRVLDPKGEKVTGGFLWVVSPEDSKKVAEFPLEAPPVYQGVAVSGGRVYVSLQNGQMVCFGKAD